MQEWQTYQELSGAYLMTYPWHKDQKICLFIISSNLLPRNLTEATKSHTSTSITPDQNIILLQNLFRNVKHMKPFQEHIWWLSSKPEDRSYYLLLFPNSCTHISKLPTNPTHIIGNNSWPTYYLALKLCRIINHLKTFPVHIWFPLPEIRSRSYDVFSLPHTHSVETPKSTLLHSYFKMQ